MCGGCGVDVAVDMVGHQSRTLTTCCDIVKRDGEVLLFGLPPSVKCEGEESMKIPLSYLINNVRIICSHSPGNRQLLTVVYM